MPSDRIDKAFQKADYVLSICFSGRDEAISALLRMKTDSSEERIPDVLLQAGVLPDLEDNSIVYLLPTEELTLSALHFFEKRYGRAKIRLRHSDGWECCEAELLGNPYIEDRYQRLFGDDSTGMVSGEAFHNQKSAKLILASKSPRRREYLKLSGIPFTCDAVEIDEMSMLQEVNRKAADEPFGVRAACTVMYLAEKKALAVSSKHPHATILGSDTLVTIDGDYLGKPETPEEALQMIKRLAGRDHHVWTGVSIVQEARRSTFYSSTRVRFLPWTERMEQVAHAYIATGSPMDKAGGYGIQDMGALLIKEIRGDFYTVVGLPLQATAQRLFEFGF